MFCPSFVVPSNESSRGVCNGLSNVQTASRTAGGFFQVAKKWSDKKDVIVKLSKEAEGKKLAPGDYTELTRTLKKVRVKRFSVSTASSKMPESASCQYMMPPVADVALIAACNPLNLVVSWSP